MITSPPAKLPLFEPPDRVINADVLSEHLAKIINSENFTTLIASNFLMAMSARDRRLARSYFEDVLVTTFNFQNRLVRIAELNTMLENLASGKGFSTTDIKAEVNRHMVQAIQHQARLMQTLELFKEMRGPEDPVA